MNKIRLGIIGSGGICEFHMPALKAAGFELTAVGSRRGSERVHSFAQKHQIPCIFEDSEDLLKARGQWDALLIAVSVEPTLEILKRAIEARVPILVEKPVTFHSEELKPWLHQNLPVMVGYNRRYYRTVQQARKEVKLGSFLMGRLNLPESIRVPAQPIDNPLYLKSFFSNSVHGLDMMRFIFGNIQVKYVHRLTDSNGAIHGIAATFSSQKENLIQFTAHWQAPDNFSLTLDRVGRRFELRPFESASVFEGMEVVDPTPEIPVRTYRPKMVEKIDLEEHDKRFKPGFFLQAQAFAAMVRGENPKDAARLEDAYAALVLAEQLAGKYLDSRI
ncbi:MAG: Gfo/Idh/MocA family oxidoreductase [Candidatus Omnitrophica bacterium]|nr:Gfo/Idh/MocA family oxidoreductase [Candidatus Omnitrophota bacterium]